MSAGSFYGGAAQGLMGALKYFQNQQRIDMEQQRADREDQVWNQQEALRKELGDISGQEATERAAGKNRTQAQEASNQALANQQNEQADQAAAALRENVPDAPPEQEQAVRNAYKGVTPTGDAGAKSMAAQALKAADDNGAPLTDQNKRTIENAYGLNYRSDPRIEYDYSMRRAAAFDKAGDFKTALSLRKDAHETAAGHALSALFNKDSAALEDLANIFPNGKRYSGVSFDDDGKNILFKRDNGTPDKVPVAQAALSILSSVSQDKAATLMAQMEARSDTNELRREIAALSLAFKYGPDGPGGRNSRNGTGGAGSGKDPVSLGQEEGHKALDNALNRSLKEGGTLQAPGGKDGKTMVPVDPTSFSLAAHTLFDDIYAANPNVPPSRIALLAHEAAKADFGMPSMYQKQAAINPATGGIGVRISAKDPDGTQRGQYWINPSVDPTSSGVHGVTPDKIKQTVVDYMGQVQKSSPDNFAQFVRASQNPEFKQALTARFAEDRTRFRTPADAAQYVHNMTNNAATFLSVQKGTGAPGAGPGSSQRPPPPKLSAQDLALAQKSGVSPYKPELGAGDVVSSIGEGVRSVGRVFGRMNFNGLLNNMRQAKKNGQPPDGPTTESLAQAIQENPSLASELSQEELAEIRVGGFKRMFNDAAAADSKAAR